MRHLAVRALARALVALYPREFRDEFGPSMVDDFVDTYASRRSALDRMRFVAAGVVDAFRTAALERAATDTSVERRRSMFGVAEDVRFGLRALRRRPGFVAAVVLTLALGIGANTAVFSLVDAVFLRPVAVAEPERVVAVFQAATSKNLNGGLSFPAYQRLREDSRALSGVAAAMSHQVSIAGPGGTEMLNAHAVSGNYFTVLGVRAHAGRLISTGDDGAHGASPVVVLSYPVAVRWYGDDESAIGKTVEIADRAFTVVGVAPATFRGTELADVPDVWAPLSMLTSLGFGGLYAPSMDAELFRTTAFRWLDVIGRIAPKASHAAATAELNTIIRRVPERREVVGLKEAPVKNPMSVMPITQSAALRDRDALVRFVRLMFGVVALTLLLACANVANLLLVRSSERAREIGVRAALGAGRGRIVRQLFIESTLLAIAGAAAGLAVALATLRLLSSFTLPGSIALSQLDLTLDTRVLAFTALVAPATAIVFGLAPALRASKMDLAALLRRERASQSGGALRHTLVATQVALALALLVGAMLFARSLRAGLTTDIGFDPSNLAAVSVELRTQGYDQTRMLEYYTTAEHRLRGLPGIERIAIASHVPLARANVMPFKALDATVPSGRENVTLRLNAVNEDYFATIGLPFAKGRGFTRDEARGKEHIIILNEAAVQRFWPNENPIGRTLTMFNVDAYRIIGVVPTTKYESLTDADMPLAYLPLSLGTGLGSSMSVVVRSAAPSAALHTLQQVLASIDPSVSLRRPRLVGAQIDDVLMPQRFGARLFAIFSLIALVVASIGVHGVVSYGVSLRRRELGIRIALGARTSHIYWTVLRASLTAVAIGAVAGVCIAAAGSPALAAFLYGVRPLDGIAFAGAAAGLVGAAVAASIVPARRASRLDPVTSIRSEG
jgi:predicted permease